MIRELEDSITATSLSAVSPWMSIKSPGSTGGTTSAASTSASEPTYEKATNVDPNLGTSEKMILEPTISKPTPGSWITPLSEQIVLRSYHTRLYTFSQCQRVEHIVTFQVE